MCFRACVCVCVCEQVVMSRQYTQELNQWLIVSAKRAALSNAQLRYISGIDHFPPDVTYCVQFINIGLS